MPNFGQIVGIADDLFWPKRLMKALQRFLVGNYPDRRIVLAKSAVLLMMSGTFSTARSATLFLVAISQPLNTWRCRLSFSLPKGLGRTIPPRAQTPDFNIAAAPLVICVSPGEAASCLVTVSSTDGFQGNVDLVDSIDPNATNGPTLSPIPSSVSLTSDQSVTFTLTASTVQATPEQGYTITIIGGTDVTVHSATVYLTVRLACGSVGGSLVPVNNIGLLAPYAIIAATIMGAGAGTATLLYNRRTRVR